MSRLVRYLDAEDIVWIIAKYFDVPKKDVDLIPYLMSIGYGPTEHDVPSIRAEIRISDKHFDK